MKPQTAVVLGATGLIGREVVKLLLHDNAFDKVRLLVRRPVDITHPKLEVQFVDFDDVIDFKTKLGSGDCIFCCIGTTNSKVKGDKVAYRKVDYDIPVNAANFGVQAGFTQYLLVSAIGSNASSNNFYIKLKGEVEDAITTLRYNSIHIFQPSLLLGERKEFRLGELIAKGLMQGLSFLFAGPVRKYKAIKGGDVAKAMVIAAKRESAGVVTYQYNEMMQLKKQEVTQDQHQE